MTPFLLSIIEGRKPELDFPLLSLPHLLIFLQCFVHHRRICKLFIHSQPFPAFQYPVHNPREFMGDNILCQIRVDFVFGNLDVEGSYQESSVKTVRSIIGFRKFIKTEYHFSIIGKSCNILIKNLGTYGFSTGYPFEEVTSESIRSNIRTCIQYLSSQV